MSKITVQPNDDPNAANAEIEIIIETDVDKSRVMVAYLTTPAKLPEALMNKYVMKCFQLAFEKLGYRVHQCVILLKKDEKYYIHATMTKS